MIEIDDEVHQYLVKHTQELGESGNAILRRLFGLPSSNGAGGGPVGGEGGSPATEMDEFLGSREFTRLRNVKDRFVSVLGELYRRDPGAFEAVLHIGGRKRRYFGRSKEEVAASGKSVAPRPIPNSPFWVMTNASTEYKGTILRQVMETLGYGSASIRRGVTALGD
jgi:negative modulator of initiation of replication